MAFIGMRHVVAAKLSAHVEGSEPTYAPGMVIGKAISGNLTITRGNNPLYADDVIAEDDNGITAMDLEIGMDDLLEDAQVYMGLLEETTSGQQTVYYDTNGASYDVGIGYIRVRKKNGVLKYQAVWAYSAKFAQTGENAQTKGETIEWQTPTITGRCRALVIDDTGTAKYRKKAVFDSAAAAYAWLDGIAGIPASGT